MTVVFMLPGVGDRPAGGFKVVYEYANRLAARGHRVHIAYAGSLRWSRKTLYYKLTGVVRFVQRWLKGRTCRGWFALDPRVKEHLTLSLCERHVSRGDVYVATSPLTAQYLGEYRRPCRRVYFIQGYENWGGMSDEELRATYHLPLRKIVISRWLERILREEEGVECAVVPNGFDFKFFELTTAPEDREAASVSLVYGSKALKGWKYAEEAVRRLRERYGERLRVQVFGAEARPAGMSEWMEYTQQPTREQHNAINNSSAVFMATSLQEGWGLPVGEAMMTGQAVVCTDCLGYREMARDGENALMVPAGDAEALYAAACRVIDDRELRLRLARRGLEDIRAFDIEASFDAFLHEVTHTETIETKET